MAVYVAPGAWDFHAHGHAAFVPESAKRVLDGRGEGSRAARRRALKPGDSEFLVAMKRTGAQHAMFMFRGASPAQREAMVSATDHSGSTTLHWAAEFGFAELVAALLTAGSDPQAVNSAGLTPLEYAAKEGHVTCAETLAQAVSLAGRPRATAALRAVAQAPWRVMSPTATPLVDFERHSAAAALVCALRRLLQPRAEDDGSGLRAPYFEAGRPLLARLAALDSVAPGAALCLRLDDGEDVGTVAPPPSTLHDAAKRAADAATVAIALAGALTAPEQAAMASLRVRGFALPHRPQGGLCAVWPYAHPDMLRTCTTVNALTECAMVALGDSLSAPAAPRHVTIELEQPFSWRFVGISPSPFAEDAAACLPSTAAAAFSRALRAGWAQNGALRILTIELPPGMRLCPQQQQLLRTRALEAPHAAVMTVLLGACHPRSRSPLRLLSNELLRRVLEDCIFAVHIVERDAPDE